MVIDGKGYEQRSYFGDLIMGACQAAGFKEMVIDGYTRDRDGNIELGFPVFSRGGTAYPVATSRRCLPRLKMAYEEGRTSTIKAYRKAKAGGKPLPELIIGTFARCPVPLDGIFFCRRLWAFFPDSDMIHPPAGNRWPRRGHGEYHRLSECRR